MNMVSQCHRILWTYAQITIPLQWHFYGAFGWMLKLDEMILFIFLETGQSKLLFSLLDGVS
uniref:Uncharacterized protein n=1 Tax=Arundo donax TaxID=35708 RepID=A0A0A8YWM4_ARUDO